MVSFQPQVIVGSSIGGALATQLKASAALVLIASAMRISWVSFGFGPYPDKPLPTGTIILYSRNDKLVPLDASRALLHLSQPQGTEQLETVRWLGSGLSELGYIPENDRLLVLGGSHSCHDPDPAANRKKQDYRRRALADSTQLLAELSGTFSSFRAVA